MSTKLTKTDETPRGERSSFYKLIGRRVFPLGNSTEAMMEWAQRFSTLEKWHDQRVGRHQFGRGANSFEISTVFLGLDHAWSGPPELFESRIFGSSEDGFCERYATYDEAERGHAILVALMEKKTGLEAVNIKHRYAVIDVDFTESPTGKIDTFGTFVMDASRMLGEGDVEE